MIVLVSRCKLSDASDFIVKSHVCIMSSYVYFDSVSLLLLSSSSMYDIPNRKSGFQIGAKIMTHLYNMALDRDAQKQTYDNRQTNSYLFTRHLKTESLLFLFLYIKYN